MKYLLAIAATVALLTAAGCAGKSPIGKGKGKAPVAAPAAAVITKG